MIKKAFILGAGLGTRLRPLTNVRPKPLVPLFHRPMVEYAFDRALELGIRDIAVNTHHLSSVWSELFPITAEARFQGLNGISSRSAKYREAALEFFQEDELLETGGGIKNIEPWIGDDEILIYNGDIYCSIPLQPLVTAHETGEFSATLLLRTEGAAPHIALDGDRVVDIRGLLGKQEGTHQFTGIYCVSPSLLPNLNANQKESIIPAFLELVKQGKLGAVVVDEGEWFDLGTREMYLAAHQSAEMIPANASHIEEAAVISEGAQIDSSWISRGARVEAGAVVKNSILWPSAKVGEDAIIENCIVYSEVNAELSLKDQDC